MEGIFQLILVHFARSKSLIEFYYLDKNKIYICPEFFDEKLKFNDSRILYIDTSSVNKLVS